ncbi:hypothetical protein GQ53DRAFT_835650 [Thozetella sp. PMI_491]|nr:hypothetical protein GQ53DRAFT_835650 [Thozetella sp. PMI_491]
MPRYVDTLPPAVNPKEKTVIVLSYGRNGTLGLYRALQKLGYNPCHMATVFMAGEHELKLMKECFNEGHSPKGKPYNKDDLQKWLGQYDSITDITPYVVEEVVAAWPDAKFILTTREPERWYRSAESTIFVKRSKFQELIMDFIAFFDPLLWEMSGTKDIGRQLFFGDAEFMDKEAGLRVYQAYNERARTMVPKEQLLEVKLEDGLGWEQLCPFLGKDIPDEPYPRTNAREEFQELYASVIGPHFRSAFAKLATTILVPSIAVGAWYYLRYTKR